LCISFKNKDWSCYPESMVFKNKDLALVHIASFSNSPESEIAKMLNTIINACWADLYRCLSRILTPWQECSHKLFVSSKQTLICSVSQYGYVCIIVTLFNTSKYFEKCLNMPYHHLVGIVCPKWRNLVASPLIWLEGMQLILYHIFKKYFSGGQVVNAKL